MDRYEIVANIGKGSSGTVFLARSQESKKLVAVKKIQIDENRKSRTKKSVVREATILRRLQHPCILKCEEWYFDQEEKVLNVVLEYCDRGTMQELVQKASNQKRFFPEEMVFGVLSKVLTLVLSRTTLSRKLKEMKFDENAKMPDRAKLGDFGISKEITHTLELAQTCVGTPCYLSPELCQDIPYSSKSDIWALGCLLYELTALKPAFDAANLVSLFYKIVKGDFSPFAEHCPKSVRDLVSKILHKDPDSRPTAVDLLAHPALRDYAEVVDKEWRKSIQTKSQRSPGRPKGGDTSGRLNAVKELSADVSEQYPDGIAEDIATECDTARTTSPGPVKAYTMFLSGVRQEEKILEPKEPGLARSNTVLGGNVGIAAHAEVPKLYDDQDESVTFTCDEEVLETARPQTCPHSATRRNVENWYGDPGSRNSCRKHSSTNPVYHSKWSDGSSPVGSDLSEVENSIGSDYSDASYDGDSDVSEDLVYDDQVAKHSDHGCDNEKRARRKMRLPGSSWLTRKKLDENAVKDDHDEITVLGQEQVKQKKAKNEGAKAETKQECRIRNLPGSAWLKASKPTAQSYVTTEGDQNEVSKAPETYGHNLHDSSPDKRSLGSGENTDESDYSYSDDFDEDDYEYSEDENYEDVVETQQLKSSLNAVKKGCVDILGEGIVEDLSSFFKQGLSLSQVLTKLKGRKLDSEAVETCYLLLQDS